MCKYWPNTCLCFSICANTDANTLTNTSPIQSNTDLYRLKYRPIQAPQTNAHIIVFNDVIAVISSLLVYMRCHFIIACLYANTGISTVKSGASNAPSSTVVSEVAELSKPYTASRLLVVCIQFLCVVRQQNFPRSSKFLRRWFGRM